MLTKFKIETKGPVGQVPYVCAICGFRAPEKSEMDAHQKYKMGDDQHVAYIQANPGVSPEDVVLVAPGVYKPSVGLAGEGTDVVQLVPDAMAATGSGTTCRRRRNTDKLNKALGTLEEECDTVEKQQLFRILQGLFHKEDEEHTEP